MQLYCRERERGRKGGRERVQTFFIAIHFVRAIILTVVKEVAAKHRVNAASTGTLELILLTRRRGRRRWGSEGVTQLTHTRWFMI